MSISMSDKTGEVSRHNVGILAEKCRVTPALVDLPACDRIYLLALTTVMPTHFKTHPLPTEQTFVMIKPDGVMRGLIGEIIHRFEMRGLRLVALQFVQPEREKFDKHYPTDPAWIQRLGEKGLKTFAEYNLDPVEYMGTADPTEIGQQVRKNLIDFMILSPVVQMVWEGLHAVSLGRKLIGSSFPLAADPGTIRGDFSHDTPTAANLEGRTIFNLVHASETPEEAQHEIDLWFTAEQFFSYDLAHHVIMFGDKRAVVG
jgi:nucleoside-diphosphate kinase